MCPSHALLLERNEDHTQPASGGYLFCYILLCLVDCLAVCPLAIFQMKQEFLREQVFLVNQRAMILISSIAADIHLSHPCDNRLP
jgi:hypothetical protein